MPAAFIGSAKSSLTSASSTVTVATPLGTQVGDLMVAVIGLDAHSLISVTAPAGWISIHLQQATLPRVEVAMCYKVAVVGDVGAQHTFVLGASDEVTASISTFRGVRRSNPIRAFQGAPSQIAPQITASSGDLLVYAVVSHSNNSSIATPAGMTVAATVGGQSYGSTSVAFATQAATGLTTKYSTATSVSDPACIIVAFGCNNAPGSPVPKNLTQNGGTIDRRPRLQFDLSDPDVGDALVNLQAQVSTDLGFGTTILDIQFGAEDGYGTSSPSAFHGLPTSANEGSVVVLPPVDLPVGPNYVRVRVQDSAGDWGDWSVPQGFTVTTAPWTDSPGDSSPGIRAAWLNELVGVINAVRAFRGVAPAEFTDGTLVGGVNGHDLKRVYLTERMQAIADVMAVVGLEASWTDIPGQGRDKRGLWVKEMRSQISQV